MPHSQKPPPMPSDALARPPASSRPDPLPSPWDSQVLSSAPAPTPDRKALEGAPKWLGQPIADPRHAELLEQDAAVNEFGKKMPRPEAERAAYGDYVRGQRVKAAAHHLAGMRAASAAGDKESARKHGLMYELHSRAIGHDPAGPVHPAVAAAAESERPKVYKFKSHQGDLFALGQPSQPSTIVSSAPGPMLGKAEVLRAVWEMAQEVLAKAEKRPPRGRCGSCGKTFPRDKLITLSKPTCQSCFNKKDEFIRRFERPHDKGSDTKKAEASPGKKSRPRPCICSAYKFPHRHKSGKCGEGK